MTLKPYGSITLTTIDGRDWNVDVAREVAESELAQKDISDTVLDKWADENCVVLSEIAVAKINAGKSKGNWVKIAPSDWGARLKS